MEKPHFPRLPERPERFSHLSPSPYAPLFIEKLLLALIEANDGPHKHFRVKESTHLPGVRLRRAMCALFGVAAKTEPINDVPALVESSQRKMWKASEWQHEVRMLGLKSTETTTHFSEIIDAEGQTHSDAPDRKDYARLIKKAAKKRYLDYLYQVTNEREHGEETEIYEDLRAIAAIFARWGVSLELDPDRLGLHSLSHSWPAS